MGALDQIESFLQELMERPARLLSSRRLQPVQLASALTKELEERALRLADRIVVPSVYTLSLSPEDYQRVQDVRSTLESELAGYVERLAAERELTLPADPSVQIQSDASIPVGRITAHSAFPSETGVPSTLDRLRQLRVDGDPPYDGGGRQQPCTHLPSSKVGKEAEGDGLDAHGDGRLPGVPTLTLLAGDSRELRKFPLDRPWMSLGRRSDNDIPIPDLKISRHHARLEITGRGCFLADLESTNGTRVNGRTISGQVRLQSGDIIEVGLQHLRYDA